MNDVRLMKKDSVRLLPLKIVILIHFIIDFKDVINNRDSWPFGGDGFTAGCRRSVGDNLFANYEGGTSFSVDQHSRFKFYTGKPFFEISFLKK